MPDKEKTDRLRTRLTPCLCGASRRKIERMRSIDVVEMGIICLACERFALGSTLTDSIRNWNRRMLGTED